MKFCLLISTLFLLFGNLYAFDAAETYDKKCSSCHTIGADDVGPNLQGVTKRRDAAWIKKFIKGSQAMITAGDPIGAELFAKFRNKKMPDIELSDDEIDQILAYIEGASGGGATVKVKSATEAKAEDIAKGKMLFEGKLRFEKKGPACLSCHSAGDAGILGGGALGPDLARSYTSFEDKGLTKVLSKISFPSMVIPFKNKELTTDEVFYVKSYLYSVDKAAIDSEFSENQKKFAILGVIGTVIALLLIDLAWKNRRKKTRRPLGDN